MNIENNIKTTKKRCSKCDKYFDCQNFESGCWCENYQLSKETLAYLRKNYDNCLCQNCIVSLSKQLNTNVS
ncbi:MAG: cysteine-rich CWC family protein [Flavobacteriales bacterium]|nr:cysteine-rich CWC family protein [Flavobacteriales bacterium]